MTIITYVISIIYDYITFVEDNIGGGGQRRLEIIIELVVCGKAVPRRPPVYMPIKGSVGGRGRHVHEIILFII